ncbi:MAG: adenosylcobinamide-phosphate synthase CbiB [Thermoleophilia bacterium]
MSRKRFIRRSLVLASAFALDAVIGDPVRPTHPARLIGRAIQACEWVIRRVLRGAPGSPERVRGELLAGRTLAVGLPAATFLFAGWALRRLPRWARPLGEVWLVSTALAGTDLVRSAGRVEAGLSTSLDEGRRAVSLIVSRDTRDMTEADVIRSTVESVAENTSDAVVAPLLFAAAGGAPLALAFKAISTLDSMVGYKNERYLHLGRASARLDDVANFIPARLTALLALLAEGKGLGAVREAWSERVHHASPNAGLVEAAFAHALGVKLGGTAVYGGAEVKRPELGGLGATPPTPSDLARVASLSRRVGVLALGASLGGLWACGRRR